MTLFYKRYADALYGQISRIISDPRVAEEALQDALLKVWNKIEQFDIDKSSIYTWASVIARNTALDKIRLKRYEVRSKTDELDPLVYNNVKGTTTTDTSNIDVANLTKGMEAKYREVLDLVYLNGHSSRSAADQLNIPIGTVKTRLRKAVLALRENLKSEKDLFLALGTLFIIILLWLCL